MRFIHSLWTKPLNLLKDRKNLEVDLMCYALSFSLLKKLNHQVVLHTDDKGKELLSFIPYDEIILDLNNIPEEIHPRLWSAGKFFSLLNENIPVVHIDGDVFIYNNNVIDKQGDLVFQNILPYSQNYMFTGNYLKKLCKGFKYPNDLDSSDFSNILHLGYFGLFNQELKDKIIKTYIESAVNFSKLVRKDILDSIQEFEPNLLLEEQLIGLVAKPYHIEPICDDVTSMTYPTGIYEHFAGDCKYNYVRAQYIEQQLKDINPELLNKIKK